MSDENPTAFSAEDLLASMQAGEGGWDDLVANTLNTEALQENAKKAHDLAKAYTKTFGTPHGQKVLDDLMALTVRCSTALPKADNPTLEQCTAYALMRDGQNSIIAHIGKKIVEGQQAPPDEKPKKKKGKK